MYELRDVRVDKDGDLRCWNCGGKHFLAKRTGRAHIVGYLTVSIGALVTKKKLKCYQCGKYNQVGNAQPYSDAPLHMKPQRLSALPKARLVRRELLRRDDPRITS